MFKIEQQRKMPFLPKILATNTIIYNFRLTENTFLMKLGKLYCSNIIFTKLIKISY